MIVKSPRRRRAGLGKALAIQQQPPLPGLIARLAPSSSSSAAAAAAAAARHRRRRRRGSSHVPPCRVHLLTYLLTYSAPGLRFCGPLGVRALTPWLPATDGERGARRRPPASSRASAPPRMGSEDEFDEFDEEVRQKPREMIMSSKHMTRVEINGPETIERYLSCPICLGLMRATTATECLHRFCSECIESAIRLGRKECPTCRAPIATRRALRRDLNFDNLVRSLYPDVDIEEEVEEMDISQYLFTAIPSPPRSLFMGKDEKPPRTKHERLTSPVPAALPKSLATPVSETKRAPPAALEQWTCETCTLLNAGSARKCKACEAPNPNRPSRKRLKREKPTETALEVEQAEAEAPNGAEGTNPTQGAGAEERLVISEWKFANGLVPSPEPTKAASRPRTAPTGDEGSSGVGSRLPAGSVARQSDWDREIARAWERKRGLEQETHERRDERQRLRDSEHQSAFAAAKALVSDIGGSKRTAPLPTAPLDFDEKTMSIEAQLLVRGTFSLDIKHKGGEGIHAIWSYPAGNPGDCNAWVSIAPADRVAEANARQKYKLLTKNKVCGEVRCARDSAPPRFALAA